VTVTIDTYYVDIAVALTTLLTALLDADGGPS